MSFSQTGASINRNNFRIKHSFVPKMSGRSIYEGARWVNLELLHGNNLVLKQTPLFVIVKISNGLEDFSFAHLQKGIKREAYGDLLESFDSVKNYCDIFKFKEEEWKLGYYKECDYNTEVETSFPSRKLSTVTPKVAYTSTLYNIRNLTAAILVNSSLYSLLFCLVSVLIFVK